jgi:hypothetical protein
MGFYNQVILPRRHRIRDASEVPRTVPPTRRTRSVTYHTYPGPRTGTGRDEGLGVLVALVGRLTFLIRVAISRSLDTEAGVPSSVRIVSPS